MSAVSPTRIQLVFFALPALISVIMHAPIAGIIPALYSAKFGLSLATIATVMLAARVLDAAIDPLIGYWSDRTASRWGKRKPWVFAGSLASVALLYFVLRPGESATLAGFLVLMLALTVAWTAMEIPYAAWVLELSRDPAERMRIGAYRTGMTLFGAILFTVAPALVAGGGSMNFEVLGWLAIVLVLFVPLAAVAAVRMVPTGEVYDRGPPPRASELWHSVKGNRPFMIFVLMYGFIGLASGVSGVLSFMYMDSYLGIGQRYTELFLPATLIGPLSLPLWVWLLNRFDRHRLTAGAFAVYALIMPIPWLIAPGPTSFLPMMLVFVGLSVFMPLLMITMPTILGDVVDFDELRTGKNRSGQYNAFLTMISKGTGAVGGPLALGLVGWFGYQPGAQNNPAEAVQALRIVYNLLPTVLVIPGVLLLWFFPITGRRQREIREQLRMRASAPATARLAGDPR